MREAVTMSSPHIFKNTGKKTTETEKMIKVANIIGIKILLIPTVEVFSYY
jgi:hypothetical protein